MAESDDGDDGGEIRVKVLPFPGKRRAKTYVVPDPATIKREWLHAKHYLRGIVSATVAPGGFGKTTLALHECLVYGCCWTSRLVHQRRR
jgi:hypothetical protein